MKFPIKSGLLLCLFSSALFADSTKLNIEIVGKGKVTAEQMESSCTEDCQLTPNLNSLVTLNYENVDDYEFSHWNAESCDFGSDVIIDDTAEQLIRQSNYPKEIAIADFNGDGIEDLATISLFASRLEISLASSLGNYALSQSFEDIVYASSMVAADWNNDQHTDIFVVDYHHNHILGFINDGNGNFSQDFIIEIPDTKPYSIAIADIDGDGFNDLLLGEFDVNISAPNLRQVVSSIANPSLRWYKNLGNDEFEMHESLSTDAAFFKLSVGKIYSDSNLDIAGAAINLNEVITYKHDETGYTKSTVHSESYIYGVAIADIDKDSHGDLLTTSYYGQKVHLLNQTDDGNFIGTELHVANTGLTSVHFSDIDGDEILDVIWGEFDSKNVNWKKTNSFKTCHLNMSSERSVVAVFKQNNSAPGDGAVDTPETTQPKTKKSGGSTGQLLALLMLGVASIRRISFKQ